MTENNGQTRSLSTQLAEREITTSQWHTLAQSLYPGARQASVLLVVDYCRSRGLDPLKKPCHIVPMDVYNAQTGGYEKRDVVLPGIYELRTTAQRTGEYLGHSKPEYGPIADHLGVSAPEWCEMAMFRWNDASQQKVEFPVRVYFREACGTKYDKQAKTQAVNARWSKAPIQMLTKCTEAAGLREAFPDEIGGEMAAEEADSTHRIVDVTPKAGPEDLNAELGLTPREPDSDDEPIDAEFVAQYDAASAEASPA
jgi:phage recombination protein Bet